MTVLLDLFLTFLEIGAVSFGGGYGMISLIREKVLINGWLTEEEFLSMIAVAESTPGPIAVNMATFVGASQEGIFGALAATVGVILPSFIIILVISALISGFLKYAPIKAFIKGVQPCVVGLICATAFTMLLSVLFGITNYKSETIASIDYISILIFALLLLIAFAFKKISKKKPSPIIMILISASLGMAIYSFV